MSTPAIPNNTSGAVLPGGAPVYDKREGPPKPPKLTPTRASGLKAHRDLPHFSVGHFEAVSHVKQALLELEQAGIFFQSSQMVDAMGRDDRIEGVLDARVRGFLALPLEVKPASEEDTDEAVAEAWRKRFDKVFPPEALAELKTWGIMLGAGVGQLRWEVGDDGLWWPRLHVWHPRYLRWDWNTRSYWVTTDGDGQQEVTPGDGTWVLYTPYGAQRGWMKALVRRLAVSWLIRQWALRDWARNSEVLGIPIRKALVPMEAQPEDKDRFVAEVASLANETTIKVEQSSIDQGPKYDVELVEAAQSEGITFDKLLQRVDTNIAVTINGQNLTTEVKGGSYAAAQVHENVRSDVLAFDGKTLHACVHEQVMAPWAELNLGARDRAPRACWNTKPPEDEAKKATALGAVGTAITNLGQAGVPVDGRRLAERFNVPMREDLPPAATAGKPQVYGYHFDAGIMTRDEGRAMVGLPPIGGKKGGEILGAEPEPKPGEGKPAELSATDARPVASARSPLGALRGQVYADALADAARHQGGNALRPSVEALLALVDLAEGYDELRTAVVTLYKGMDEGRLAQLLERTLIMADLAGRHGALEDL
jgi:phage gp29-like protein